MMKRIFSKNVQLIVASICIITIFAISLGLVILYPDSYNPLTQIMLDFMLLIMAAWLGNTWSTEEAKKNALEKWVPMAETASKDLLVMNMTVKRLQHKQGNVCQAMKPIFDKIPEERISLVTTVLEMRCNECTDDLETLRLLINNSFSNWDAFIETNCEENVCEQIHKRLDEKRKELEESPLIASSRVAKDQVR